MPQGTLYNSAVSGLHDIIRCMVDQHGQAVDMPGFYSNEMLLSSMSQSRHLEVIQVLLHYGADASSKNKRKSTLGI